MGAKAAAEGPSSELSKLQKLQMRVTKMALGIGIVILLLTAIATAL